MDPLTAAGLASSIIAFVDFTSKVLSRCQKLYRSASGATTENLELEHLATTIRQLAEETRSTKEDEILESLSSQCISMLNELIALLNSVKVKSDRRGWASIHQALKSVWKQSDVDNLQQRLNRIQAQLYNRLLDRLIEENERLEVNRTQELQVLRDEITSALHKISSDVQQEGQKIKVWSALYTGSQKGRAYSTEQLLLSSLLFRLIDHRTQKHLPGSSHKTTKSDQVLPPVNLVNWLRRDNGLYWISGKPGSGKSTFMEFLAGHEETKQHLKVWSGGNKLVMASFYFWSAAKNPLQKSQTGLLRSILYQILRQCPEFIRVAFPGQWSQSISGVTDLVETPFSSPELLEAFDKIPSALATYKIRFCFFIDGLDEYEGRPTDIIQVAEYLKSSQYQNLSTFGKSNPWKLSNYDLTREDIQFYVEDRPGEHECFRELQASDDDCPDFANTIVGAARGVFLWVSLVVNSLVDGLTNADTISSLQERLQEFPRSLNEYFQKALTTIEERYRPQMARALAVTLEAYEILPVMCYWFLDQEAPDYALKLEAHPLDIETIKSRTKTMRTRLNAYCKGLLEVEYCGDPEDIKMSLFALLFSNCVGFLHRTVRDFLWTPGMQALLRTWLPQDYNLDLDICKAVVGLIKNSISISLGSKRSNPVERLMTRLEGDAACETSQFALLDDLARAVHEDESMYDPVTVSANFRAWMRPEKLNRDITILAGSVQAGLARYTEHTLKKRPHLLPEQPQLLLSRALMPEERHERDGVGIPDTLMLQILLRDGADPNMLPARSAWTSFLQCLENIQRSSEEFKQITNSYYQAALTLLEYGADPGVQYADPKTAVMLLQEIFSPAQYSCLQRAIENRQLKNGNGAFHKVNQKDTRKQEAKHKETEKLRVVRSIFGY
ncbi:hypothetical protein ASPBRDRAFT_55333 [Aspergillus brasiliensis CBS 101740]|uniref:NACHT domain-containing protein n=1 Tax=Aspergillus brasiliensis (strain CBS 101740 / IMI 381727 / IBT 21946) TaxID=767769 RepID=A0A1L9UKA5_ASPBC|nr:hypothetical protein ASPBRDRAFT_55333 [Aspergillus brasiliensis CBS 101740]